MKQELTIAVITLGAFLLGVLMPRPPQIQERVITKVERDTLIHTKLKSVPVEVEKKVKEYVYIRQVDTVTVTVNDTVYIGLPRQYYYAETDDVKIWHSGIDSRIDSLVNFRETKTILPEPWKRHSIGLSADVGFNMMGIGAEYEYGVFEWFSISANAGYDFHLKQPYVSANAKIRLYSW